jgi:hypothetical protein
MDTSGLIVLVAIVGGIALELRRRIRRRRMQITRHRLRCPLEGETVDVTVETDPEARAGAQYREVLSCSLKPPAIDLPGRTTYLWDGSPMKVRLEPACTVPAFGARVTCAQPCLAALNAPDVYGVPAEVRCSSGVSDAVSLAEQALGGSRMARLLWYTSL